MWLVGQVMLACGLDVAGLVGQVVWLICQVCLADRSDVTAFVGQVCDSGC